MFNQLYAIWELLLVVEASGDETASVAENLRQRRPDLITVIRNPETLGLQKLAKYLLSITKDKYTMRVDADDWLDEGRCYDD